MLATYFPQIVDGLDRPIILDDGTLVSRLAPQMNAELEKLTRGGSEDDEKFQRCNIC